jgi:nucleotide-binding universal stress UspA family protein
MKNILIPTDFSDSSKAAASYAIEFAKASNASITFLHVFHIPMVTTEVTVVMPNFDELEKDSMDALLKLEESLRQQHQLTTKANCIVKPGFLIDEMKDVIKENKIDLVIMGIAGAGKLAEVLIGSNTTIAIQNLDCEVLVIPSDSVYKPIKNIAFACDFIKVKESPAINKIKNWAKTLNAKTFILNIVAPEEKPSTEKAIAGIKLESIFDSMEHSMHFPENDDITYAINDFVEKHNIDLLIMIPKKYNIFTSIFHKSNTKRMAFHSHIPLLTIHE